MRVMLAAIALLSFTIAAPAADFAHKLLYGSEATACGASAADGISTALAIGAGAHETNPFLVKKGSGDLSIPKLITLKSIMCAGPIVLSWIARKKHPDQHAEYISFVPAVVATVVYSNATAHNFGVIADIKRQRMLAARVPDYLKAQ